MAIESPHGVFLRLRTIQWAEKGSDDGPSERVKKRCQSGVRKRSYRIQLHKSNKTALNRRVSCFVILSHRLMPIDVQIP